jgi:phenylacetate-CoA ligase
LEEDNHYISWGNKTIIERFGPYIKSKLEDKPGKNSRITKPFFEGLSRRFLNRYELKKLKRTIRYAYNNSPFYQELFKKHNIKPADIKSFKDMEKIPCTMPEDLQNNPKSFFAVPEEKFVKVFTTSGATGKPKKAYFTEEDIEKIITFVADGAKLVYGISSKDVVRLSFEVGYGTEIWGNRYCLDRAYGNKIGALVIATGRLPIKEELEIIKEYKPTVFADVSSRINYLTNEMKKICDLKELGVKKFLVGAEPTPNSMRRHIEREWNADVFIGYGLTELGLIMAGECEKKNGMHLSETSFLAEVVDPDTGEQLNDGEVGELLFTTFDRKGMPLIRYNSHDLGRIIPGICKCGLPFKRIEIKGRSDDLIPIGAGDNLFTKMFDEVIFSVPEVEEYQVQFDKKDGRDLITVTAETEVRNDAIRKRIVEAVMRMPEIKNGIESSKTVLKPIVKLVKPNTFDRNSIKFHRLVDNRNLYD